MERWKSLSNKEQIKQLVDKNHMIVPEDERPQCEAASPSYRAQDRNKVYERKGEGKGKIYGHAGLRTFEQTNRCARDWQPPAMHMNTYDATFRDGSWTNPRHRRDPRHWDAPYWNQNFKTTRRSWREWDQDLEEEYGEEDHEEDDDTQQDQG